MKKSTHLLVEMPSMLGNIVTKRGRLLRDGGSRGVSTLLKSKDKSWLATTIEASGWDAAHKVAAKLKREFGQSVYAEPDGEGRFRELTSPETNGAFDNELGADLGMPGMGASGPGASPHFGSSGSPFGANSDLFGGIGGFCRNNSRSNDPFSANMPHIPSATDFLPKHVTDMMGMGASKEASASRKKSLKFAALHTVSGWLELAESTQKMFEVEAAQLMNNGFQSEAGLDVVDDYSALVVLAFQPGISHALRNFIEQGTVGSASPVVALPLEVIASG